jgi:hypothetical protein
MPVASMQLVVSAQELAVTPQVHDRSEGEFAAALAPRRHGADLADAGLSEPRRSRRVSSRAERIARSHATSPTNPAPCGGPNRPPCSSWCMALSRP